MHSRFTTCLIFLLTLCLLAGCAAPAEPAPESRELVVFAAASLTETLTTLGRQYMADHPEVTLLYNFDSSGTLKTQIQEGADCDIFLSAGQKQMDQLDITADASVNTEGLDWVLEGSRFNILENKVALAVPEGTPGTDRSVPDHAGQPAAETDLRHFLFPGGDGLLPLCKPQRPVPRAEPDGTGGPDLLPKKRVHPPQLGARAGKKPIKVAELEIPARGSRNGSYFFRDYPNWGNLLGKFVLYCRRMIFHPVLLEW